MNESDTARLAEDLMIFCKNFKDAEGRYVMLSMKSATAYEFAQRIFAERDEAEREIDTTFELLIGGTTDGR